MTEITDILREEFGRLREEEYEAAEGFRDRFGGEEVVVEARRIVSR